MDLAIAKQECLQKMCGYLRAADQGPPGDLEQSFEIQAYSRNRNIESASIAENTQAGLFFREDLEIIARMNYLRDRTNMSHCKLCYQPNWMNCPFAMRIFMKDRSPSLPWSSTSLNCSPTLGKWSLST